MKIKQAFIVAKHGVHSYANANMYSEEQADTELLTVFRFKHNVYYLFLRKRAVMKIVHVLSRHTCKMKRYLPVLWVTLNRTSRQLFDIKPELR